jgi:apolipoprotein N-acyltransferase
VICFELAYDKTVYDVVRGGAQVIMVQSNNATYGGTGQIEQQFAITRARAMEARREIAVATTNSVSGFIDRDGQVVQRTSEFTAAGMVVQMPLRSALTPAIRIAPWFERGLALVAALGCLAAALGRRRDRLGRIGNHGTVPRPEQTSGAADAPVEAESETAS